MSKKNEHSVKNDLTIKSNISSEDQATLLEFKKRMLEWPNPVEYVNNMYGCHPDDNDNEYFKVIFAK